MEEPSVNIYTPSNAMAPRAFSTPFLGIAGSIKIDLKHRFNGDEQEIVMGKGWRNRLALAVTESSCGRFYK